MVEQMSRHTQFILITHNKRTMEIARVMYGVTMEEPGVSKLVSVRFDALPAEPVAVPARKSSGPPRRDEQKSGVRRQANSTKSPHASDDLLTPVF
jgi:hypothetical protein